MANKIPPPPTLTSPEWQPFNRWLLELTNILNSGGYIDAANVEGLLAAYAQIAANVVSINLLNATVSGQGGAINILSNQINVLQAQVAALQSNPIIRTGTGAPVNGVTPGNVGDLYLNITATGAPRMWAMLVSPNWQSIA